MRILRMRNRTPCPLNPSRPSTRASTIQVTCQQRISHRHTLTRTNAHTPRNRHPTHLPQELARLIQRRISCLLRGLRVQTQTSIRLCTSTGVMEQGMQVLPPRVARTLMVTTARRMEEQVVVLSDRQGCPCCNRIPRGKNNFRFSDKQ
eukprot:Opistho-2@6842